MHISIFIATFSFLLLTTAHTLHPRVRSCAQGLGSPGAVYRCFGEHYSPSQEKPYGDGWIGCSYDPPDVAENCQAANFGSIGPDPGGYCKIYDNRNCTSEIKMWRLGMYGNTKIVCPGYEEKVPYHRSMKCFKNDL